MADYGTRYADNAIRQVERELKTKYRTAQRELKEKLADFNQKFNRKDKQKRQQLAEGKITKQQYQNWLTGQVFMRSQFESQIRQINGVLNSTNQQAMDIINNRKLDVFAENYNFMAFKGEGSTGLSFNLYNAQAVARLLADDPQILPEWKIDQEKDYQWNQKKVNNIVTQGIIQGEGVREISDRLCRDLCAQNENRMDMFARTAITGAQNAGRQQQMEDASAMGINVHKQWLSTMDSRTRDSHRAIDGEEVDFKEDFSNGLEYPGDPAGDPAEVYNCRCTMVSIYPDYEDRSKADVRRAYGEYEDENGETHRFSYLTNDPEAYKEWKQYKDWQDWKEQKEGKHGKANTEAVGTPKRTAESAGGNLDRTITDEAFKKLSYDEKIEAIKDKIKNHEGEWKEEEVRQIGGLVREAVEDKTRMLAAENAQLIAEKEQKLKEAMEKCDKVDEKISELQHLRAQEKSGSKEYKSIDRKVQYQLKKLESLEIEKQKAYEEFARVRADKSTAAYSVLAKIREMGGVTKDNINYYANFGYLFGNSWERNTVIDGIVKAMDKYPSSWLEKSKEYGTTLYPVFAIGRQSYNSSTGRILISEVQMSNDHEVAHRMETCVPSVLSLEKAFYERRTKDCPLEVVSWGENGQEEYGRKDDFVEAYIGRDYKGTAYEVVSMGYSMILHEYEKLEADKDMLDFILGLIAAVD